jgi:hypothetical protein
VSLERTELCPMLRPSGLCSFCADGVYQPSLRVLGVPLIMVPDKWYPSGLTCSQKAQILALKSKRKQGKEAEKILMMHIHSTRHHKKVETKGRRNNLSGHKNRRRRSNYAGPCMYRGQSGSSSRTSRTVRPPESRPFAPHQESSNDTPTPMDEDNVEEDDLLGEDLVDYEASPEHLGMDVNVITFSVDYTIIGDDEPLGGQIQVLLVNTVASAHTRIVRPLDADRPVRRREDPTPTAGRGPFGPRPHTICAAAEGTARA